MSLSIHISEMIQLSACGIQASKTDNRVIDILTLKRVYRR
jgi:hypothetical protein